MRRVAATRPGGGDLGASIVERREQLGNGPPARRPRVRDQAPRAARARSDARGDGDEGLGGQARPRHRRRRAAGRDRWPSGPSARRGSSPVPFDPQKRPQELVWLEGRLEGDGSVQNRGWSTIPTGSVSRSSETRTTSTRSVAASSATARRSVCSRSPMLAPSPMYARGTADRVPRSPLRGRPAGRARRPASGHGRGLARRRKSARGCRLRAHPRGLPAGGAPSPANTPRTSSASRR